MEHFIHALESSLLWERTLKINELKSFPKCQSQRKQQEEFQGLLDWPPYFHSHCSLTRKQAKNKWDCSAQLLGSISAAHFSVSLQIRSLFEKKKKSILFTGQYEVENFFLVSPRFFCSTNRFFNRALPLTDH